MPVFSRLKSQDWAQTLLKSAVISAAMVIFAFSILLTWTH